METVYLSRRNLLTLLSKLDRYERGEETQCTLIKYRQDNADNQQTMDSVAVIAIPDSVAYQDRLPGVVSFEDDPSKKNV